MDNSGQAVTLISSCPDAGYKILQYRWHIDEIKNGLVNFGSSTYSYHVTSERKLEMKRNMKEATSAMLAAAALTGLLAGAFVRRLKQRDYNKY